MLKLNWLIAGVPLLLLLFLTWFYGLKGEVVIAWILLIPLSGLTILNAYKVRLVFQTVAALGLAALIFVLSVSSNVWSVKPEYLQDIAIGIAAAALWRVAADARTDEPTPKIGLAAAIAVLVALLTILALALIKGIAAFASPKMFIATTAVAAVYDMAAKRWKTLLALVSVLVIVVVVVQYARSR